MGCFIVLMALAAIPILVGVLVLFFGALAGSIVTAILTTIIYMILKKNGIFERYCNSPVDWQRALASILRVLLIFAMVISYILSVVCTFLLISALN